MMAAAKHLTWPRKRQWPGGTHHTHVNQEIVVRDVDPAKLAAKLNKTFGPSSFEVHVRVLLPNTKSSALADFCFPR
jgi:hypothetical protein